VGVNRPCRNAVFIVVFVETGTVGTPNYKNTHIGV
jgi:hypothetical protein